MGRMKDLCIEIMEANGGIPEGMTIRDLVRMKEMEIYNWEQYEREQEKIGLQQFKSENPGEDSKIQQADRIFEKHLNQSKKEQKNCKQ